MKLYDSTFALIEKENSIRSKTRHILQFGVYFLKDRIVPGEVVLEYLPTGAMVAELLTKPLYSTV